MPTIDISNCKEGCSTKFIQEVIDCNKDFDGTIYIYDNDLVDEGCEPYSITQFKPGDKVRRLHLDDPESRTWTIVSISPATYGFMNVLIKDNEGIKDMSYSGDLKKAS